MIICISHSLTVGLKNREKNFSEVTIGGLIWGGQGVYGGIKNIDKT